MFCGSERLRERIVTFHPELAKIENSQKLDTEVYYASMVLYYVLSFEFSSRILDRVKHDYMSEFLLRISRSNLDSPVLILGSGGGRDVGWIAQRVNNVVVVDSSEQMIRVLESFVPSAKAICMNMVDYMNTLKSQSIVFSGILNESGGQHLNKDEVFAQLKIVSSILHKEGIYVLGLKTAPDIYEDIGPVYSVQEGNFRRYFISWSKIEISKLIDFAKSLGLSLIMQQEAEHLKSNEGTPAFIRLFFSPTP